MGNMIINIIGIFILIVLGQFLYFKLHPKAFDRMLEKKMEKNAALLRKADSELQGKRFEVARDNASSVKVNLYMPRIEEGKKVPCVFIAHGGNFMDGSADQIDTFCNRVKDRWEAVIVSIDYTLVTQKQFPYQHEEIRDTVMFFAKHASEFHVDTKKFALAGFSAGAYLMTGSAALLKDFGFKPAGVILNCPIIDDTMIRLADAGKHPSPCALLCAGKDPMAERLSVYTEHLNNASVDYVVQTYAEAYGGFIEANNPEYAENPKFSHNPAISEEQENMAKAAEIWMGGQLERFFTQPE